MRAEGTPVSGPEPLREDFTSLNPEGSALSALSMSPGCRSCLGGVAAGGSQEGQHLKSVGPGKDPGLGIWQSGFLGVSPSSCSPFKAGHPSPRHLGLQEARQHPPPHPAQPCHGHFHVAFKLPDCVSVSLPQKHLSTILAL